MRFDAMVGEDGVIRVTDPAAAARLGLRPGEHVTVDASPREQGREPSQDPGEPRDARHWAELTQEQRVQRMRKLRGLLHDPNRKPISIEEMNEGIADAVAEEYLRGISDCD